MSKFKVEYFTDGNFSVDRDHEICHWLSTIVKRDNNNYWKLFRFKQKREKMEAEAAKRKIFQDCIKKIIMFKNFHEKLSATGMNIQI